MKKHIISLALALLVLLPATFAFAQAPPGAGELVPSIGNGALDGASNPQPSMKTLEVTDPGTPLVPADAPFAINDPGHYYLTGNVTTVDSDTSVIVVNASFVTIDLRGFAIVENPGGGGSGFAAVSVIAGNEGIRVVNGTIQGGWQNGVFASTLPNCSCEDLSVFGTQITGIQLGDNARVFGCRVDGNFGTSISSSGINVRNFSQVDSCIAIACSGRGIEGDAYCSVIESTSCDNGTDGMVFGTASVLTRCVAVANTEDGIAAGDGSVLSECLAFDNDMFGIIAGAASTIDRCTAYINMFNGFSTGSDAVVSNSLAEDNGGNGFDIDNRSLAENCIASRNGSRGFNCENRCLVRSCTADDNNGDGFSNDAGGYFISCIAARNGQSAGAATSDGFDLGNDYRVQSCMAYDNRGSGFHNDDNSAVAFLADNTFFGNDVHGMRLTGAFYSTEILLIGNFSADNATLNFSDATGGTDHGPIESPSIGTSPNANFQ